MKTAIVVAALASLIAPGCGNDSTPGGTTDLLTIGSFSCLIKAGASTQRCSDSTWTGDASSVESSMNACATGGGTPVAACDRTGALGGCLYRDMSASGTIAATTWYYSGTVDGIKAACATLKMTFVAP